MDKEIEYFKILGANNEEIKYIKLLFTNKRISIPAVIFWGVLHKLQTAGIFVKYKRVGNKFIVSL